MPARVDGRVSCRLDQVVESPAALVGDQAASDKDLESANCPLGRAAESLAALADVRVELDRARELVSCPQVDQVAARPCFRAWATGQAILAIGQVSFRIEHLRSGETICKTDSLLVIGMIDSIIDRTGVMTGKIDIRTSTIATTIGIMAAGATTAIGGATCGVTIRL